MISTFSVSRRACAPLLTLGSLFMVGSAVRAQTDFSYGGDARSFAMGGAGVALTNRQQGIRFNPASLVFENRGVQVRVPTFALRANGGIGLGRVSDFLTSGQDEGDAADIAREFSKRESSFGLDTNASIRFGKIEVSANAVARGYLTPNSALRDWSDGGQVGNPPLNGRSDITAAGYYTLPAVAVGFALPTRPDDRYTYGLGVRAKVMRGFYTHYFTDANVLINGGDAQEAPEMDGSSVRYKTGFGADVGFLMQPRRGREKVNVAFVVANLIRPNFKFDATDTNGNFRDVDVLATTATAGASYQVGGLSLAADLADLFGSSNGGFTLRAGGEYRFPLNLAVRGGYSSATGFTYGGSLFGFDFAFSERQPLEVLRTLKF